MLHSDTLVACYVAALDTTGIAEFRETPFSLPSTSTDKETVARFARYPKSLCIERYCSNATADELEEFAFARSLLGFIRTR